MIKKQKYWWEIRLIVRVLDEENLTHVPMSLRERTSASDIWLAVIKCL